MEYKIKNVDVKGRYNDLLEAYYYFFEYLYGKSPISFIIHRQMDKGTKIPASYELLDTNFEYARDALKSIDRDFNINFIWISTY